ncbi:ribosomal-protein-alanine N-acetyltransferase [Cryobacterium frigoriphilum]|uniref:Ribosomal-protein-alanine N-acetyltransferase n=2 Tax=Cryobacterium frigoriphilum TaxID=1259150 RepID=A0A4R9A4G4_9MICO|nr:ribosomal-protein-alanine N-acetyltransferase [Cryobacterium frigoriphilum]
MHLETTVFQADAWSSEMMRGDIADANCFYLVAFPPDDPERIEGYAGLLAARGGGQGDIQTIAVAETARGRGLGRVLMLSLIGEARKRGAREVFLEVRADNPSAQRLYARLGFDELGVRRGYYQPDNVDAIVMRLTVPEPQAGLAAHGTDLTQTPEVSA